MLGNEIDETEAVDNLFSKELLQLSMEDRNELAEEIHGVRCLALDETPELLQASVRKLASVLESDNMIPRHQKLAYLQSQSLPWTYINGDDFRLRFLRLTLFDAVKAAKRIVRFLDLACYLFGNFLLERPVRLSDFNKKELQYIRNGCFQFLPFRDRSSRRIFAIMNPIAYGQDANAECLGQSVMKRRHGKLALTGKIMLYMTWVAGDDIDTQRKGIVFVVWFDPSFKVVSSNKMSDFANLGANPSELASVRVIAVHCCLPDTIVHRFCLAVLQLRALHNRVKLKAHLGTYELYGAQSPIYLSRKPICRSIKPHACNRIELN